MWQVKTIMLKLLKYYKKYIRQCRHRAGGPADKSTMKTYLWCTTIKCSIFYTYRKALNHAAKKWTVWHSSRTEREIWWVEYLKVYKRLWSNHMLSRLDWLNALGPCVTCPQSPEFESPTWIKVVLTLQNDITKTIQSTGDLSVHLTSCLHRLATILIFSFSLVQPELQVCLFLKKLSTKQCLLYVVVIMQYSIEKKSIQTIFGVSSFSFKIAAVLLSSPAVF